MEYQIHLTCIADKDNIIDGIMDIVKKIRAQDKDCLEELDEYFSDNGYVKLHVTEN